MILFFLFSFSDVQSHIDKGIFALFYLYDHIQITYTNNDLENYIANPSEGESGIFGERIIEVIPVFIYYIKSC